MPGGSGGAVERVRVRLRRDPGDEVVIDGRRTRVQWPGSFIRVGPGMVAEVVLDLPDSIQSFPMEAWTGTPDELLQFAVPKSLQRTQFSATEIDVDLAEPFLAVRGEAPYITAFALCPCTIFGPPQRPASPVALVAVPSSELVLIHLFKDATMAHKAAIAARMAELAGLVFERSDERQQVSRSVYTSHANKWLVLEDAHASGH